MPLRAPAEKHLLDLVEAQTKRIDSQVGEIERLWKQVVSLQKEKLDAKLRADEHPFKYSQLKLEAQLGFRKVVAVAIAVVIVTGLLVALVSFRHTELAVLLRAARQAGAVPIAAVPAASSGSAMDRPSTAPGGSAAAASGTK